jgi:hypothetical protein
MQDGSTPQGQAEIPVIDFSTILPNMPKLESQEIVTQEVGNRVEVPTHQANEPVVNEFIIVDGERVEVNLDEIVGNHPDGTPIKLRETDNPKSYKYFQARDTKNAKRLKEMEEKLNAVQKPQVQPEVKLEPPKRPTFPQRPKDYDPTEAVTNPESPSYQFERQKEDYYLQKDVYDKFVEDQMFSFKGQIETERTNQLKSQEELARQAQILGQIQQVGGVDTNEAKEIWETYSTPKDDTQFLKDLVEFHHFKKGQRTPQAQQQIAQFEKNTQRQSQYLPPPGVIGTQSQVETPTLGDALMETVKKYRI